MYCCYDKLEPYATAQIVTMALPGAWDEVFVK